MPTKDDFTPDYPLPVFLSQHADQPQQPGIGIASDRAVISSRILKTSILVITAAAIAIVWMENPVALFASVTASLVDISAFQLGTDQSTPTIQLAVIQSTADTEALPPTAKDAPTPETSALEPVSQALAETSEASSEALFREFQAWAAEQDARALAKPVQDAPAPVVENAPTPVRPAQKQRRARSVHHARAAEIIRRVRERRANVRQQNERIQARSVQDARAQAQSVQNAEAPSFLQSLNPFAASPPQR